MRIILAILAASCAFGAGTVQQSISGLGTGSVVIAFNWTGDASTGSVPATAAVLSVPCVASCAGYNIVSAVTQPGSPAPTSGYALTLKDNSGLDLFGGNTTGLSATATQTFAAASGDPPLNGTVTLTISGQNVASAKGIVYLYLTKPGFFNTALLYNPSTGSGGSTLFTSYAFGNQTPIIRLNSYLQTTYPNLFTTTQSGSGTAGSPYIDAIGVANQSANTVWAGPTSGSAVAAAFRALVTADLSGVVLPRANGGLNSNSAGTGILRDGTTPAASELSGDATTSGSNAVTVVKVDGVSYGTTPGTNTVPVVTGSNTVTYEAVPNAALANSATTVNGQTCTLGSTCTVSSGSANQATLDCGVSFTDAQHLTFFPGASSTDFCAFSNNNGLITRITAPIVLVQSGSVNPAILTYVSDASDGQSAGTIVFCNSAGSGIAIGSGSGGAVVNTCSAFPVSGGIYRHSSWTSTVAGSFDATGTLYRPLMSSGANLIAGAFMVFTPATSGTTGAVDTTKLSNPSAANLASAASGALAAGAGTTVCVDGSGGLKDTGCSGTGGNTPVTYSVTPSCIAGTLYPNGWAWQTTNAPTGFCANSSDGYQGGFISFSAANTKVAAFNVPVPSWWTSGAVTLALHVIGEAAGTGNIQFQAATYCKKTGTVYGSGQSYNSPNATTTATSPTPLNYVTLTISSLTMTGCSGGNNLTVQISQPAGNTYSQPDDIIDANVTYN